MLLRGAEASVEREHLRRRRIPRIHAADGIRGIPDLRLAGEEHEHIAGRLAVELAQGRQDAVRGVGIAARRGCGRGVGTEGAVADLDGVGAAGDLDDRHLGAVQRR